MELSSLSEERLIIHLQVMNNFSRSATNTSSVCLRRSSNAINRASVDKLKQTQAPLPCGIRWTHEIFLSRGACHVSSQEHTVSCTRFAGASTWERKTSTWCARQLSHSTRCAEQQQPHSSHCADQNSHMWTQLERNRKTLKQSLKTSRVATRVKFPPKREFRKKSEQVK